MIEVGQDGFGMWVWTMISAAGRLLMWRDGFCCEMSAVEDAKAFRRSFFIMADAIDHRQARGI